MFGHKGTCGDCREITKLRDIPYLNFRSVIKRLYLQPPNKLTPSKQKQLVFKQLGGSVLAEVVIYSSYRFHYTIRL